jgi:hypothetical protein
MNWHREGATIGGILLPKILKTLTQQLPFILFHMCNTLNLGVEFFSSFLSPNSGVTLSFSLFHSLNLDLSKVIAGFGFRPRVKQNLKILYFE